MIDLALGGLGRGPRAAGLAFALLLSLAIAFLVTVYSELAQRSSPVAAATSAVRHEPASATVALGDTRWGSGTNTYCEAYVEWRTGIGNQGATAFAAYQRLASLGVVRQGPPPRGALVYFGPSADNEFDGHVGIADGAGLFTSVTYYGVQQEPLAGWQAPYLGWVAPADVHTDRFGHPVTPRA